MMNKFLIFGFIAAIFLGAILVNSASAQYQPQFGQRQFQGTRTSVNGTTYDNPEYGVKVSIPSGWSGFETKRISGGTSVTLAPGGFQSMQMGQRPPVTISISMAPTNSSSNTNQFMSRFMQGETCTNSTSTKTVNGLNFNELIMDCTGNVMTKSKYEMIQTSSSSITLGFRTNPSSGFDSQVSTFDNMINTLQLGSGSSQSVTSASQSILIPSWVKKNAGYWATGQVADNDFVQGIQYMISNGIVKIPHEQSSSTSSQKIPVWVKSNAGFWATGQIADDQFVQGIQYMISNGIIQLNS